MSSVKNAETEAAFPPGARVVIRDEEWVVRAAHRDAVGGLVVEVVGLSALVRNQTATFLSRLDAVRRLEPAETALVEDPTPGFRRSRLYLESLLRRTPPTDARIHVGHLGAVDPLPFQLEPAAKALALPRARILIADDVGLGKTIEVGVLLAELIRRGQGRRILVVTLKSLLGQFQRELWHRFTIPLVALDSVGIEKMRAKVPATTNPFHVYDRVIVSVDTLKKDARYRRFLEKAHWDAVVIDECQNVAVRATGTRRAQRARLAELLADTCDALVLTSATPHDGRPESFASLMNLLDPTAIHDPKRYTPEDVRALYVRRFKKDVAHQVQKRFCERLPPRLEPVGASPAEDDVFRALRDARFASLDGDARGGQPLFRTVLLKALLSSPTACRKTLEARRSTLSKRSDAAAVEDSAHIAALAAKVEAVEKDLAWPKFDTLVEWLREAGWTGRGAVGERVVIFSERVDTLEVLEAKLNERLGLGEKTVARFYGALRDTEQDELVRDFGVENGKTRILLASDAASEGINLHFFCHRLIHFDIPWSLITLEQRNGRIDRFGQTHAPDIRYLLVQPGDESLKGDLRVLHRLVEREGFVHQNLGDAGWLMRCYDPEKEELLVAEVIEEKRTIEEVLPEAVSNPGDDILAMLLDAPVETPAARVDPTATTLSLYADDLAFARAAFEEIAEPDPTRRPKFLDHLAGFTLDPPDDLARRYASIPRAFRTAKRPLQLTSERTRVTDAIEKARAQKGATPEWELFWPLHPVADWLCDRVLAAFARHEAPVLEVPRGMGPGEAAYVYQGIYANERAEPRIVAWFAVVHAEGGDRVVTFEDLVRETGLDGALTNTTAAHNRPWLALHLQHTIVVATQYMDRLRKAREASLVPDLQREERRVRKWREAVEEHIEAEQRALDRAPRADEARRFADRLAEVTRIAKARETWLNEGLRTIADPVLRLAAVIVGREVRA